MPVDLNTVYNALSSDPIMATACGYAAVSHTVNILAQRVKERDQRRGHVLYIYVLTLFCFFAGPTLLSLLQGTPVAWIKSPDALLLVSSQILLALFLHPVWAKFRIFKLLFVIIGSSNFTVALLKDQNAYGNWLSALLVSTGLLSSRVFFLDVEDWAWGSPIPSQLTPRTILLANALYYWLSGKQDAVVSYLSLFAVRFVFGLVISPAHFFAIVEGTIHIFLGVNDRKQVYDTEESHANAHRQPISQLAKKPPTPAPVSEKKKKN